jgi:hypothetical protein
MTCVSYLPCALESRYWLPPYAVKQSGMTTIIGCTLPEPTRRSMRSASVSPQPDAFMSIEPRPV